jgi:hypothetical protein
MAGAYFNRGGGNTYISSLAVVTSKLHILSAGKDNLPAPAVIIVPAKIIDMICITEWAVFGGEISATRGRRRKERLRAP